MTHMKARHTSILFAIIVLCSCSKLPMKDFLGVWTVSQVEAHDITSNNDRIVSTQAASPCFFVGEQMEFTKTKIIPCPTSTINLKEYKDFPGTFDYTYDSTGSCITIHEVSYINVFHDPETGYSSTSAISIAAITYKISLHDSNTLCLSGERYEYDKLGNATRCYTADIILKR